MIPFRIRVGNQTSKEAPYADTFHFALRHRIPYHDRQRFARHLYCSDHSSPERFGRYIDRNFGE